MNIIDNKKILTARYLLELFSSPQLKVLIAIFAVTGIAIGYGFGLLSEVFSSTSKGNSVILTNVTDRIEKIPSDENKFNKTITNKQLQKNTFLKSLKSEKSLITYLNLPTTTVEIDKTALNQKQIKETDNKIYRNLSKKPKTISRAQNLEKQFDVLLPSSTLQNSSKLKPKIAIVFDDLGIDMVRSAKTIKLKGPLTLSFLTYAPKLKEQTENARKAGHELWMHMPMEPLSHSIDPGPNVLLTGLPKEELQAAINWNLKQFSDYVGINNHMGSHFTADLESMRIFMKELKKYNLMFLDSRTSSRSVAKRAAIEAKVPFIMRNIFIDHTDETGEIIKNLALVERLARKSGYAVAIGHPRDKTLKQVGNWLSTFEKKGLQLVSLSKLVRSP